ncbi:unnamed protein product [Linum tenue]|uniref:Secreted protein n=1 Tax=Linum tenue TaxID=586396 RepID=A0AAV0LDK7_9ROSI|nr:unnamed protein product [Linum tenue]
MCFFLPMILQVQLQAGARLVKVCNLQKSIPHDGGHSNSAPGSSSSCGTGVTVMLCIKRIIETLLGLRLQL